MNFSVLEAGCFGNIWYHIIMICTAMSHLDLSCGFDDENLICLIIVSIQISTQFLTALANIAWLSGVRCEQETL